MEVCSIMPVLDYPYTLNIGDKAYPILRDGFSLKEAVGAEGKHRSSSCNVSVRGGDILNDLMFAEDLIDAVVKDDEGNVLFTGVIRPHASVSVNQTHLGNISLEVLDYSEKMHVKVYESPDNESKKKPGIVYSATWDGLKVSDPNDKEKSLVHKILALCGISNVEAPSIPSTVYRFALSYGEYLDDKLSNLLYEFIYDYYFDKTGKLVIFQTGPIVTGTDSEGHEIVSDLESSGTISTFIENLQISRADDKKKGALVSYPKYDTQANVLLFSKESSAWNTLFFAPTVVNNFLNMDKDVAWDLSKLPEGYKDAIFSNFWIKGTDTKGTSSLKGDYVLSNCSSSGGHIKGHASGLAYLSWGFKIEVFADISYMVEETGKCGYAGDNAENYSASYVQTIEDAMKLAYAINARNTFNLYSYSFKAKDLYIPGNVYTLSESKVSGLSVKVRILARKRKDDTGIYEYEAEGYGAVTFSEPAIKHEKPSLDITETVDFFQMKISENIISEEDDIPILATASGMIFDKYGATPRWYINGALQETYTSVNVSFSKTAFAPGKNVVRVSADYEGETYSIEQFVTYVSLNIDPDMQYTVCEEGDIPNASSEWLDEAPEQGEGEIIWVRFRLDAADDWTILRWTGPTGTGKPGQDGGNPILFFQWAATPYVRPDEGWDMMAWDTTAILWENPDGTKLAFVSNTGAWENVIPTERPYGLNYLWVKFWNYQINDWDYYCATGTPAASFKLIVNPKIYQLTTRGVTKTGQKIIAECQRKDTVAAVTWHVSDGLEFNYVKENVDSKIEITLPDLYALPSFTITCSVGDVEGSEEFIVTGEPEGKSDIIYLGVYPSLEILNGVNDTSEGPKMVGDHALVETENGRVPYYWTGTEWKMSDGDTPSSVAFKILQNTLYDGLKSPNAVESQSIINLYAANLAAVYAFIMNMKTRNIQVGDGDGSEGSGFRFRALDALKGEKVNPIFDVMYGNKTIFKIVPSSGKIFFGEPNTDNTVPASGFMYDPDSQQIISKDGKTKIKSDGTIEAQDTIISGNIQADSLSLGFSDFLLGAQKYKASFYSFSVNALGDINFSYPLSDFGFTVIYESAYNGGGMKSYCWSYSPGTMILTAKDNIYIVENDDFADIFYTKSTKKMTIKHNENVPVSRSASVTYMIWVYEPNED